MEAALPVVGPGWGAEVEEIELVGVTGDEGRIQRFVSGLVKARRKKVTWVRLVRVKGTPFSTGQLAVGYELAVPREEASARDNSPQVGLDLRPLGRVPHAEEESKSFDGDPTASLAGFLRSLQGTQTTEVCLSLPFRECAEDLTVGWVDELAEALKAYGPKTQAVHLACADGSVSAGLAVCTHELDWHLTGALSSALACR